MTKFRLGTLYKILGGRSLETAEDGFDLVGGPVEVFDVDGEGRGEADGGVVGLFGEEAGVHEGFADGAGGDIEFEGDP